jgi:hypothetical protein
MRKRVPIIISLVLGLLICFYCIYGKTLRFRFYKSDAGIETMVYAFSQLEPYVYYHSDIPNTKVFFEYLEELSKSNELFPEDFESSLGKLKSKDFVFTTDYSYIYVWLFSESEFDLEKDTITFAHAALIDFLLEKNYLVALYPYPSPCRKELLYIEKDRKSVKNNELYDKLNEVLEDIWYLQIQQAESKNNRSLSLCCFHIYFNNDRLVIENYHNYVQDECRLNDELEKEISKRLSFLKEQFYDYDYYIQFYIEDNSSKLK